MSDGRTPPVRPSQSPPTDLHHLSPENGEETGKGLHTGLSRYSRENDKITDVVQRSRKWKREWE